MAVDTVVGLPRFMMEKEQIAIQEAASAGLKSMEHLIRVLSSQTQTPSSSSYNFSTQNTTTTNNNNNLNFSEITDFTVSKFKKVINLLDRTGHARFRRAPPQQQPQQPQPKPQIQHELTPDLTKQKILNSKLKNKDETLTISNNTNSSFLSSVTGEATVSDGKIGPFLITPSAAKPPLSSSHRKRSRDTALSSATASADCHCPHKKSKSQVKRTIRVPAVSSRIADIPQDNYSWRKYGQKPIKGSPNPRGYYKCTTVKDCPARKKVERAQDDPNMLIVTYGGEHLHTQPLAAAEAVGFSFQYSS